ncbi:hypothetical protein CULT_750015 [[Clostridium] ultunense Esp]|nr:hypothetical protein CULT_750015 [[Clostridium] ultunense Esp]
MGMTAFEELSLEDRENEMEDEFITNQTEPPTKRQLETIRKLANELNTSVNYDNLTKKSAGNLISRMLEEVKKS